MTMQEGIKKNNSKKDGNLSDVMETKENLDLPETLKYFLSRTVRAPLLQSSESAL